MACRNEEKAREARDRIIGETHNQDVVYKLLDFTYLKSVREFASDITKNEKQLDILVNNAGVGNAEDKISEDGLPLLMQVNYFGPVLLTELLLGKFDTLNYNSLTLKPRFFLDMLIKSGGRVINVSSMLAKRIQIDDVKTLNNYSGWMKYPYSKLCNILYTIQLAERFKGTRATTYSLTPGVVLTNFFSTFPKIRRMMECMIINFVKVTDYCIY